MSLSDILSSTHRLQPLTSVSFCVVGQLCCPLHGDCDCKGTADEREHCQPAAALVFPVKTHITSVAAATPLLLLPPPPPLLPPPLLLLLLLLFPLLFSPHSCFYHELHSGSLRQFTQHAARMCS